MTAAPDFNRIARSYRWLEYLTLGPLLARCRNRHLARLASSRQALILGDGDGRFTARLLAANPLLQAEAVDLSSTMLALLRRRTAFAGARIETRHCNAVSLAPARAPDLIVTHFFLDCLTQTEVNRLVGSLAARLQPGGLWLLSEFRIPPGWLHWPARIYVRSLYFAFRILTQLRVTSLPDYAGPLRAAGFEPVAIHRSLFGLLTTELWQRPSAPVGVAW